MGLTAAQTRQLCEQAGAPLPAGMHGMADHKFGARKKELDGYKFDSTGEARMYTLLKSWESLDVISGLKLQPRFVLQEKQAGMREIAYVADFEFERNGMRVVADFKGVQTPTFRLKAKLFRAKYPRIDLQIWTRESLKLNGG